MEFCRGSFVIFHGIQTSIDKEPYSFGIFKKGQDPPPPSPTGSVNGPRSGLFVLAFLRQIVFKI